MITSPAVTRPVAREVGRCRDCLDYTPGRPGASWGECKSAKAKQGVHHPVDAPMAVLAVFGCVCRRSRPRP